MTLKEQEIFIQRVKNDSSVWLGQLSRKILNEIVNNLSYKNKIRLLKIDSYYFEYIKNPTEKMKKIAVADNCWNIKYVEKPTEELIWIAFKQSKHSIMFVNELNENFQLKLIKEQPSVIQYIKDPSIEVQNYIFENHIELVHLLNNITVQKILSYKRLYG